MSTLENKISLKNYWYIACQSRELKKDKIIGTTILGECLAIFRDETNQPVAFQDKCPHRNYKLSKGYVKDGQLQCPYHGHTFNKAGQLTAIPSEGSSFKSKSSRCTKKYSTKEQDGFIYIRLEDHSDFDTPPFPMPFYKQTGYKTVRLFNIFKNNVTNCVENFIDVPHTVFVHDKIFRVSKNEKIDALVERKNGSVKVQYKNETDNMGWFSFFLNPKKQPIKHTDYFHAPNVTTVEYIFSPNKEFYITSHSTPVKEDLTYVYTDLTFKFGFLNHLASPIVKFQGQSVINQDITVLNTQMEVIKKYGVNFNNTQADIVHTYIESIREAINKGSDPKGLPPKEKDISFWI